MTVNKKITSLDGVNLLLAISVCVFFLCMNLGRLFHGGICLIWERETDAVDVYGVITEIKDLGRFAFPNMESDYGYSDKNGVQFTIDGTKCTAISKGEFVVGDYVAVSYLPESGYVLSISNCE